MRDLLDAIGIKLGCPETTAYTSKRLTVAVSIGFNHGTASAGGAVGLSVRA